MNTCGDCGEDIPVWDELCSECQCNYVTCDECENNCLKDEATEVDDKVYCQGCANRFLSRCDVCNELYDAHEGRGWGGMCEGCADEHFICDGCGGTYNNDEYGEDGLCQDCYEDEAEDEEAVEGVRPYHHPPDLNFHPAGERIYFGVELETDGYETIQDAAGELYEMTEDETLFYMEEDSSLDRGIEIISQPCSLAYHKHSFPWANIVEVVKRHGGKSHDTTTCGLHIHFSRQAFTGGRSKLYQIRLVYLFEKFWKELVIFSRREGRWEHNASKYNLPMYDKPSGEKLADLRKDYWRYQAVNLTNSTTIEIRIFRGSLSVNTIMASLELVDFLVKLVKQASNRELQGATWKDIMERVKRSKYTYLLAYLREKGLLEGGQNVPNSGET